MIIKPSRYDKGREKDDAFSTQNRVVVDSKSPVLIHEIHDHKTTIVK